MCHWTSVIKLAQVPSLIEAEAKAKKGRIGWSGGQMVLGQEVIGQEVIGQVVIGQVVIGQVVKCPQCGPTGHSTI